MYNTFAHYVCTVSTVYIDIYKDKDIYNICISAAIVDSLIPGLDPLQTDPGSAKITGQQFFKYHPTLYHTAALC